jgi:hypothetical protein
MSDPAGNDDQELLRGALEGDEPAPAAPFDGSRDRLRKMIRLRLDRRLSGRVSPIRRSPEPERSRRWPTPISSTSG